MWITIITSKFYHLEHADRMSILRLFVASIAAYVVYNGARNRRKDALLAELPSPVDVPEDADERALWTGTADIADGIEDDSLEPEGQLRL